ncbi:alpha/beta-hydrolase [Dothidotthia symphoricarpi CBS 119687]|uniref:Alpha/beta-hydrolase n=1 Tax=Dothidotthia symphoricarpi CBS 119687 TaxID=1392245 RepID=A0A6A6ATJ3_9PLEO|nr:alpha/beta-hydrolase [Dothidotthia symphoricarpi CBS 119687]KAF2134906.1 alpha/beta-hydrolase [Dothidotthia symphoricarpi CBS 119687]
MTEIKSFNPEIPKEEVDRLFRKLADTRLPKEPIVPDAGEDYGPSLEWTNKLYNHWLHKYSWADAQAQISEWKHYTTSIEGLNVHFIHEKARVRQNEAIPLLLIHGWPGTFFEFQNVMHPLLSPSDPKSPVFDLIVPSLPGFCWSQSGPRGWKLQDTARIYDTLMKRLGYTSYATQAGDWGHWVVRELGSGRYNACKAVHTNMCPGAPPPDYKMNEKEQASMDRAQWFMGEKLNEGHMSYAISMRTRPQTIGIAFNDNPVGIMMFVGEKYNELADPHLGTATLENEQFVNDICTTLSLYFFTPPSIMTSMLCYYNNVRHEEYTEFDAKEENLIRVPLGVTTFPFDAFPAPKAGVETTTTNLKFFKERESGGHFACMERPNEMVEDMREFFGKYYEA